MAAGVALTGPPARDSPFAVPPVAKQVLPLVVAFLSCGLLPVCKEALLRGSKGKDGRGQRRPLTVPAVAFLISFAQFLVLTVPEVVASGPSALTAGRTAFDKLLQEVPTAEGASQARYVLLAATLRLTLLWGFRAASATIMQLGTCMSMPINVLVTCLLLPSPYIPERVLVGLACTVLGAMLFLPAPKRVPPKPAAMAAATTATVVEVAVPAAAPPSEQEVEEEERFDEDIGPSVELVPIDSVSTEDLEKELKRQRREKARFERLRFMWKMQDYKAATEELKAVEKKTEELQAELTKREEEEEMRKRKERARYERLRFTWKLQDYNTAMEELKAVERKTADLEAELARRQHLKTEEQAQRTAEPKGPKEPAPAEDDENLLGIMWKDYLIRQKLKKKKKNT